MIHANKIRDLFISSSAKPGRPLFISAASGLVRVNDWLYVVADDELHLGIFSSNGQLPGTLHSLLPGVLPINHDDRKKKKPDFESLLLIPSDALPAYAGLLVIPSGSKANRMNGAFLRLHEQGLPEGAAFSVNFEPLYQRLLQDFSELNIEGAVISAGVLKLFQRGNGSSAQNAVIDLDLNGLLEGLRSGQLSSNLVQSIRSCDLGSLHGVSLSFTDATSLEDGKIAFVAAAEDSKDTYADGPCAGSVLGILDREGKVIFMEELSPRVKVEGICTREEAGKVSVLFVTDGDDPNRASELYCCDLY